MDLRDATVGVTGAGGFVGERLLALVDERASKTIGLEVSAEGCRRARHTGSEVVRGDVRDPRTVRRFAEQCDVVVHTAAVVGEGGSFERYRSINVQGSRTVAEQAARAGVELLVHLSSVMVYGFDAPPGTDESGALQGENNPYCTTKIESEDVVRDLHGRGSLDVVVLRPGDIYGPRSHPWVVRPLELMKRGLFVLPDGGRGMLDPVYVDNVVAALLAVVRSDAAGEVFNVTDGRPMPTRDFFAYHAEMLDRAAPPTLPGWMLRPTFSAVERACDALGVEPPGRAAAVDFLSKPGGFSNAKLRRLGYTPDVRLEKGMRRTRRWVEQVGLDD